MVRDGKYRAGSSNKPKLHLIESFTIILISLVIILNSGYELFAIHDGLNCYTSASAINNFEDDKMDFAKGCENGLGGNDVMSVYQTILEPVTVSGSDYFQIKCDKGDINIISANTTCNGADEEDWLKINEVLPPPQSY